MRKKFSDGYVTLVQDCLICKREVILMDTHGNDIASKVPNGSILPRICEECHQKYCIKQDGVCLINPDTGSLVVIKKEAFDSTFNVECPKGRIVYAEESVIQHLLASVEGEDHPDEIT